VWPYVLGGAAFELVYFANMPQQRDRSVYAPHTLPKLASKLETTAHWLETGAPDPADELAALVLEYGRRPLPRRATQLARKVLGGSARE